MKYNYTISYLPCQSCQAKVNCERCAQNIADGLKKHGIDGAEINIPQNALCVETDADGDTLEEYLEDLGVFV